MEDDIAAARRAVTALADTKQERRYGAGLRARLVALVRSHPELGVGALARRLDMAPQTLARIVASAEGTLVPVRIVPVGSAQRSEVRVHGPCGLVVEGLDVTALAALLRALS